MRHVPDSRISLLLEPSSSGELKGATGRLRKGCCKLLSGELSWPAGDLPQANFGASFEKIRKMISLAPCLNGQNSLRGVGFVVCCDSGFELRTDDEKGVGVGLYSEFSPDLRCSSLFEPIWVCGLLVKAVRRKRGLAGASTWWKFWVFCLRRNSNQSKFQRIEHRMDSHAMEQQKQPERVVMQHEAVVVVDWDKNCSADSTMRSLLLK